MLASILISFREALEVALVVGIVVRYLRQSGRSHFLPFVSYGALSGVALSATLGYLLFRFGSNASGEAGEIIEATANVVSFLLIGTFLFWMKHQMSTRAITQTVDARISLYEHWGVFALILTSVLREGSETALFTFAASPAARSSVLSAIAIGVLAAVVVGLVVFNALAKIPIKLLFSITSIFLVVVAAGLASHLAEDSFVLRQIIWFLVVGGGSYLLLRERTLVAQK